MTSFKSYSPKMKVIKRFIYRGFEIKIYDNCYYSFRYEWEVTAVSQNAKQLLSRAFLPTKYRNGITFHDSTSRPNKETTLIYAYAKVNELLSPFWCKWSR
jgi:hypothetical protein